MDEPLKILRNRKATTASFRSASNEICSSLIEKMETLLKSRRIPSERIVLVVILRSGIAFLDPALKTFPKTKVGVVGLKRDPETFAARWYYENLPRLSKRTIIVMLDPMLATGGSSEAAVRRLIERGAERKNIYFLGIIAAPQGLARLARRIPLKNIVVAAIDRGLTKAMLITPGIGDFGDRFFGYRDPPAPNFDHLEWLAAEKIRRAKFAAAKSRSMPRKKAGDEDERGRGGEKYAGEKWAEGYRAA